MNKITFFIKNYLIDIIIQAGILLFFKEFFIPTTRGVNRFDGLSSSHLYSNQLKFFGVMLISIGINIAIRKYLQRKKI